VISEHHGSQRDSKRQRRRIRGALRSSAHRASLFSRSCPSWRLYLTFGLYSGRMERISVSTRSATEDRKQYPISPSNVAASPLARLRLGMVGGGHGAFIGETPGSPRTRARVQGSTSRRKTYEREFCCAGIVSGGTSDFTPGTGVLAGIEVAKRGGKQAAAKLRRPAFDDLSQTIHRARFRSVATGSPA
jgi:hypothetical protein